MPSPLIIADQQFSELNISSCEVVMQCTAYSFVFCVFNPSLRKIIYFQEYLFDNCRSEKEKMDVISSFLEENKSIKNAKEIRMITNQNPVGLIPEAFFSPDKISDYLHMLSEPKAHLTIHSNFLKNNHSYCIFQYLPQLDEFFEKEGCLMHHHHFVGLFLELSYLYSKQNKLEEALYLHIGAENIYICCFEYFDLELYNHFQYVSNEDVLFYLLYVVEQLEIENKTVPLFLSGKLSKNPALVSRIQDYFKEVSFLPDNKELISEAMQVELDANEHFVLLNYFLCV